MTKKVYSQRYEMKIYIHIYEKMFPTIFPLTLFITAKNLEIANVSINRTTHKQAVG